VLEAGRYIEMRRHWAKALLGNDLIQPISSLLPERIRGKIII
jgi:hypothetical protein